MLKNTSPNPLLHDSMNRSQLSGPLLSGDFNQQNLPSLGRGAADTQMPIKEKKNQRYQTGDDLNGNCGIGDEDRIEEHAELEDQLMLDS